MTSAASVLDALPYVRAMPFIWIILTWKSICPNATIAVYALYSVLWRP
jgi:hypothetical protein